MTTKIKHSALLLAMLLGCSSETPRTQITLMIDADPSLKAQIDDVDVTFSSGPIGTDVDDYVARPVQRFAAPQWPLVLVLVPVNDDPNRAFRIQVSAHDGSDDVVIEASARSHFLKGQTLALRMLLKAECRNAVFAGCDDDETCVVEDGDASCASDEIDPSTLPPFVSVTPSSDAGFDAATDGGTDADTDSQVPPTRTVTGRIFSTEGLVALEHAQVSINGDAVETNAEGEFTIQRAVDANTLTIEHPEHAPLLKALPDAESVYLEVFVKQVDARATFAANAGGAVRKTDGSAATFPADSLVDADGEAVDGDADVTLAAPDTKDPAQSQAFPGDFRAMDADASKEGALSTAAVMDLTARNGDQKLNLAPGQQAEVSFRVKDPSARDTADLWSFSTVDRTWRKEGTATLTRDSNGNKIYRANIGHLSWWAVGDLLEDVTCQHLCAEYAGNPAAFARVTIAGVDAPFSTSAFANEDGCAAFDVPINTQLSVTVQSIDGVAAPRVVVSNDNAATSSDPSSCEDLGTFALTDRDPTTSACPAARTQCGGGTTCIDLNSDDANCGSCNSACETGLHCINGACGCASNETVCDGVCVTTRSNSAHCGSCGVTCAGDHRCNIDQCELVACNAPLVSCDGVCVNLTRDGVAGECPGDGMCRNDTDCDFGAGVCEPTTGVCRPTVCGDGNIEGREQCDDENTLPYDGCFACYDEDVCDGLDSDQDGMLDEDANCPGGNCVGGVCVPGTCTPRTCTAAGADCGQIGDTCGGVLECGPCSVGMTCGGGGVPNVCGGGSVCPNGVVSGAETCDDGNTNPTDGCSASCQVQPGYTCPGAGGPCTRNVEVCNGLDDDADTVIDEGINLVSDINNCGSCGNVCTVLNGSAACTAGICVIETCNLPFYANCDGMYATGCETDINTDPNHCSQCNYTCFPGTCASGFCQ